MPIDNVEYDHLRVSKMAVEYLYQKGHRQIGFIGSGVGSVPMARSRRFRSYRQTMMDLVLDVLFVGPLGWGPEGAALATCLAYSVAMLINACHLKQKNNTLKFRRGSLTKERVLRLLKTGIPLSVTQLGMAVGAFLFNIRIMNVGGAEYLNVYSAINQLSVVAMALYEGIAQACQPILAACFGAGDRGRMQKTIRYGFIMEIIAMTALTMLYLFGAGIVANLFSMTEEAQRAVAVSVALIIADRALTDSVSEYKGPFLFTDELDALPDAPLLKRDISPEDTFILLYTSGTTGTPKGVMLRHGNLVNFIDWYIPKFGLAHESRSAAYASFGFDANMMDTYPILCAGGQLHILSDKVRSDLRAINRYFNENAITHGFMTTQVGRQFTQITDCKTLRVMGMGGEALVPFDPPKNMAVYNLYGPTECTVLITSYQLTSGSKRLPIGVPVSNTRLYVADSFQRLLPIGAMGELLVAGSQVGVGYLNQPEKTAEVFIPNPFTDDPKYSPMYRTGDIVRWGNDGNLEFVGRRDGQVKIRGFRIELTEVESVLREYHL